MSLFDVLSKGFCSKKRESNEILSQEEYKDKFLHGDEYIKRELYDEYISRRLSEEFGLKYNEKIKKWHSEWSANRRFVVELCYPRGNHIYLRWGYNYDFIPDINSKNKLTWHRTESSVKIHIADAWYNHIEDEREQDCGYTKEEFYNPRKCTSFQYQIPTYTSDIEFALEYIKNVIDKNIPLISDMYPLYWTTSKEGIFMRYSYEFKLMCVELYHSGLYPDIPEDTNPDTLKRHIREWSGLVDLHGPEVLKHKVFNKVWTPEEKLELVLKVIAGIPKRKVATEAGISPGILYQWIYKYKSQGYNGLVGSKKGRSTKELKMKKSTNPLPLTESEREELMRLRSENEYIKAENEIIKKRIALRQEKWAAQLKAKKQQSSRTSEKKDTN